MRVVTVVGNRPQFIKAAVMSLALREAGIDEVAVHTGQHWDAQLSEIFFAELGLPEPAYRLDQRTPDVDILEAALGQPIADARPQWLLVYGDTNTTLAGARAARAAGIRLAHVEAGLRSGDLAMPEERNRIEVDSMSTLLFPPDEHSAMTLRNERAPGEIVVVGDVMADACLRFSPIALERSDILRRLSLTPQGYVVATIHREANVAPARLRRILAGLSRVDSPVVFVAHPRTRSAIEQEPIDVGPSVRLLQPLGYLDFAALAAQARVIVTDSGGLQKEAYWYGVPCVTARPSTEWAATVAAGWNTLVDADPDRIAQAVAARARPAERPWLYGDGKASERIARHLSSREPAGRPTHNGG